MINDESHYTWSFWTFYSPLFIKLICVYTSSIACKISFWLLLLTLNGMYRVKQSQQNPFMKNLVGTKNRYIFCTEINEKTINWLWPVMYKSHIFVMLESLKVVWNSYQRTQLIRSLRFSLFTGQFHIYSFPGQLHIYYCLVSRHRCSC